MTEEFMKLCEKYEDAAEVLKNAEPKALRHNSGKTQWSLIDYPSIEPMVKVLEFGSNKYTRDNWHKGHSINSLCDSLMRHLVAFMSGEDDDPESGESHVGHILCNAMFINYNLKHKKELDDRIIIK